MPLTLLLGGNLTNISFHDSHDDYGIVKKLGEKNICLLLLDFRSIGFKMLDY